jgi:hypothetical protein
MWLRVVVLWPLRPFTRPIALRSDVSGTKTFDFDAHSVLTPFLACAESRFSIQTMQRIEGRLGLLLPVAQVLRGNFGSHCHYRHR